MSVTTRVVKNSSLLIIASVINNVMTFILTLFTARYLGTYNFGLISSATSFVGVFGIFCDLGLATYAIREVSRNNELTSQYFGTTFFFRIIFTAITFVIYTIFILACNFTFDGTVVMLLFGFYMVFNSIVFCYYSLFQSNEQMKYQTIGNVIYSVSVLAIILLIIFFQCDVKIVAAGYPLAMFLSLVYSAIIAKNHYPKLTLNLEHDFVKNLITKGIPFGITSVFTSIYFWIASIILTFFSGSVAVGLFSSSQKLLLVIAAVYTFVGYAIFPIMSELFTNNKEQLKSLYHKLMKFMLIFGVPIAVGSSIYSADIINIIYGSSYVVGSDALTILIWAGVFMFLSGTCSTLLGAINKQVTVTKITAIGAIFSVIANTIMIILFSYIGASITTVCTEFLIFALMYWVINKTEFRFEPKEVILPIIQIVCANIIMAAILIYLNQTFIIGFPIAVIVYVIALFITGSISKEDRSIIFELIGGFLKRNN